MLDQTFSAENFRTISELEKRRGKVPDQHFFPVVNRKTDILKERMHDTKEFRRQRLGKFSRNDQETFDHLKDLREQARSDRDNQLLECLEDVSEQVRRRKFQIKLEPGQGPGSKPIYKIPDNSPADYYATKQLERNIRRLYKVKQSNKNQVIEQLKDLLVDGFRYHVIRTDFKNFFESIDHEELLNKLRRDQLLSHSSYKLAERLLREYSHLSGTGPKGVPRGIGISSYLSELYMREFDDEIRRLPDVVFYARYVDDIVIVFAPTPHSNTAEYLPQVRKQAAAVQLSLNESKTTQSPSTTEGKPLDPKGWSFEYVGYEFTFNGRVKIYLTPKKYEKYLKRLEASFIRYELMRAKNSKKAYRLLNKRIRFLTSNTQLSHNKSNAYVGIYFSNPHLTEHSQLRQLDNQLRRLTARISSASLRNRLAKYSFEKGHKQIIFRRFHHKNEFKEIVRAWKYGD